MQKKEKTPVPSAKVKPNLDTWWYIYKIRKEAIAREDKRKWIIFVKKNGGRWRIRVIVDYPHYCLQEPCIFIIINSNKRWR